ncbi:MAG: DUF5671 domain-containing protein [bacterium]|nr:DUF5671 domain-containing protein [bacterium]
MFDTHQHPKATPKDFFLNLLTIITLYVSSASFLTVVFQVINLNIPDPLDQGFSDPTGHLNTIRFALSSLVVFFPVYLGSMSFLHKQYAKEPFKRSLWIRKWLIYFTLFAAALIIMGDVVALVNNLLTGELKVRFFLKVVSILFVASSIFYFYFTDIKKYKTE